MRRTTKRVHDPCQDQDTWHDKGCENKEMKVKSRKDGSNNLWVPSFKPGHPKDYPGFAEPKYH